MRRFAVASLSLAVVAGALVLGTTLAAPNASAVTCTGTAQINVMSFSPATVAAGQFSTLTAVLQNCTDQPIVANAQFYARFQDGSVIIPPGCIVYDPFVRQVTIPAGGLASTTAGYSTFAGCTATSLQATLTLSVGATTLASQSATLHIIGPSASVSASASVRPPAGCAVSYARQSECPVGWSPR